jgi:hypothetical protein
MNRNEYIKSKVEYYMKRRSILKVIKNLWKILKEEWLSRRALRKSYKELVNWAENLIKIDNRFIKYEFRMRFNPDSIIEEVSFNLYICEDENRFSLWIDRKIFDEAYNIYRKHKGKCNLIILPKKQSDVDETIKD